MSSNEADRFSLTAEQYLTKYHVLTYLQDAIGQLLEHKEGNPRVVPARFLRDYFRSIVHGNHTLFREYNFVTATQHNRTSFIKVFWKCFRHIGRNGDLLTIGEYHSLVCLLCPDFPFEPVQKTARIILMDDAMECLISFSDFLYAFQVQFYYEEFIQKLHTAYQAIQGGTYRPGQVVVVPSLSRPQHKQQTSQYAMQEGVTASSVDGVDVHIFLEAVSLIIHSSTSVFRFLQEESSLKDISRYGEYYFCPPIQIIKEILGEVQKVTFYGFLMALAKHEGLNASIGTLPDRTSIVEETDQELNSPRGRTKSIQSHSSSAKSKPL